MKPITGFLLMLIFSCNSKTEKLLVTQGDKNQLIYLPRGNYTLKELDSITNSYGFDTTLGRDTDTIVVYLRDTVYLSKQIQIRNAEKVNIGQ